MEMIKENHYMSLQEPKSGTIEQQITSFYGLQADKPHGMLVEHEKNL